MQSINLFKSATQGITAILLFGIAYAAGADQMMHALPGATSAQAPAPIMKAVVVAPAGISKLPDLAFSFVSVENRTFTVGFNAQSLVVNNIVPSEKTGVNPCGHPFTFPLQLIVKNIGQADFVPKNSFQVVGVTIGQWNSAKDLAKLPVAASQPMNFNVSLPPGKYMLNANIDLHNGVAEARSDNNKLSWPLEVTCKVKANAMALGPLPDIVVDGGGMTVGGKFVPFADSANMTSVNVRSDKPSATSPSACFFEVKYQIKNIGAGASPAVVVGLEALSQNLTVFANADQGSLPNGKFQIRAMAPGASYSTVLSFNFVPGSYRIIFDIDPDQKLKQVTQGTKSYSARINASCGPAIPLGGGVKNKPAPYVQPN